MAKTKLAIDRLSVPQKLERARQIVTAMTGNADFTTPLPTLAAVTTAATALEGAYNGALEARATAKEMTALQDDKEKALDALLSQLASYVENTAAGNDAKILSAGFEVREPPRMLVPPRVEALAATAGDYEGTVDLAWEPTPTAGGGARSYTVEVASAGGTGPWSFGKVTTKSMVTMDGLTSGTRMWFRVAAINASGQGPWSDPATKIVP